MHDGRSARSGTPFLTARFFFLQAGGTKPALQFRFHLTQPDRTAAEQYQQVVNQVGGLRGDPAVVVLNSGECQFDAFFADLLRDPVQTCRKQFGRVACGRIFIPA